MTLVLAKSKVASVKQISLPRLELCAATLLARLTSHVQSVLNLQAAAVHLWTDSTVTLAWIQGHPSKWKTYVANRVAEIQRTAAAARWHHLPGASNPADCASRGISPAELVEHPLWWHGPPWLTQMTKPWKTTSRLPQEENSPEQRKVQVGLTANRSKEFELVKRFSSWSRLLRVTAWCLRWLKASNDTDSHSTDGTTTVRDLTPANLLRAEHTLIRQEQAVSFGMELDMIKQNGCVPRKGSLINLTPFIDEDGLMRVGGRLKNALLSYDERHPIILPAASTLTTLVIDSYHKRTLHGEMQQTLGLIRQKYWIPQGRRSVKKCIQRCIQCVLWRAVPAQEIMGNLPALRVRPSRPFQSTKVDYAGPFMVKTAPGRGHKAYKSFIVVFVCLSTKAVHLDLVSNYTADAFLAAFRCFTARRGLCSEI